MNQRSPETPVIVEVALSLLPRTTQTVSGEFDKPTDVLFGESTPLGVRGALVKFA